MQALIVAREQTVLDQMVSSLRAEGIDIAGTTSDQQAVERINSGQLSSLVIGGGVDSTSREQLKRLAAQNGTAVIQGALAGKEPETYARQVLAPKLRTAAT